MISGGCLGETGGGRLRPVSHLRIQTHYGFMAWMWLGHGLMRVLAFSQPLLSGQMDGT